MNETDAELRDILTSTRTIAVVGASAKPERPSHGVMRTLQRAGYRVMPVNPGLAGQTLLGETVYASLRDLPAPPDLVDIFRRSEEVEPVVADAIAVGAKTVWMQLDIVDEAAAARARAAGLRVVMDRCTAIELGRLGLLAGGR